MDISIGGKMKKIIVIFNLIISTAFAMEKIKLEDSLVINSKIVYRESRKTFSGVLQDFYPNGNLKQSGLVKDGKPAGVWEYYYENGNLHSKYKQDDKFTYIEKFYYDGSLKQKGIYIDGKMSGRWETYENNKLIMIKNYNNNLLTGEFLYYYPDGSVKVKGNFSKNKAHGDWIFYKIDKSIEKIENYINGKIKKES